MTNASGARERLIESGMALFHRKSYGAVGVDELCREAGVQKGSFYHFFPSKKDLAFAVIDANWDAFEQTVLRTARSADDPLERVRLVFEQAGNVQERLRKRTGAVLGCPFGNLAAELSAADPDFRRLLDGVFDRFARFFEDALSAAIVRRALPPTTDPAVAARALVAYYEGAMLLAKTSGDARLIRRLTPAAEHIARMGAPAGR